MYGSLYKQVLSSSGVVDAFKGSSTTDEVGLAFFVALLLVIAFVLLQLFVVRWLWNTVLVRVLTVAKPIPDMLHTLGLLILIAMVLPGLA